MQLTRKWEEDGKCYQQKLSTHPGIKKDAKDLTEKLDKYLEQFDVKEMVMSPIKEQLYFQCFSKF
jgi:hypothetical protein